MNDIRNRPEGLERHHSAREFKAAPRESYRGVDYVVAVGGPFKVHGPEGMLSGVERKLKNDHPDGFYEFEWTIFRDEKPWIGGSNVIDKNHDVDKNWTEDMREEARFNAARKDVCWAIDNGAKDTLEMDK